MYFLSAGLFTLLAVGLALLLWWRKRTFSYFKEIGIDGPTPNLICGNLWEYHRKGVTRALRSWCQKYGDIFGFYNGDVPTLVVRDLDFLEKVFIKDFQNFTNRGITQRTDEQHPLLSKGVLHSKGARWKNIRTSLAYGFTATKFKQTGPAMKEVGDIFIGVLKDIAESGREVPMLVPFQALSMDYVGRAAFGFDSSFQHDTEHHFLKTAQAVLENVMTGPFHMIAQSTTSFGRLIKPVLRLSWRMGSYSFAEFAEQTKKVIELRKDNPSLRRPDMLQNLLETEIAADPESNSSLEGQATKRKLTAEEVAINATILFVGGFETTSTTLSYLTFLIAKHPAVQEKLREEVKSVIATHGTLDYSSVTKGLKYMSQVLDETMRIYPPVTTFTTRATTKDFEYGGIKFKAGTSIMSPTWDIHTDPRYWHDPETFDPERFSPENVRAHHPLAHQPFGIGPRNCVGMRMAQFNVMYTAARMLENFRVELGPTQKGVLNMGFYGMVSTPGKGPWIRFHKL
ncbi:unnamed protein product [Ixodes hexagonus]